MTNPRFFALLLAALCLMSLPLAAPAQTPAPTAVTITVQAGARQTFRGLGVSEFNYGGLGAGTFNKLSPSQRALLWDLCYRDLHIKTLRLWWNPEEFAPQPGKQDMSGFVNAFIPSGLIADARARGVSTLPRIAFRPTCFRTRKTIIRGSKTPKSALMSI